MTHTEIRTKFLQFFKDRGHTIVPSSSLLPDDPSVLFTTAGMQQFKPYYVGKADPIKDFNSKNTVSIQKCIRTSDIDGVGDERHLTFFEMLGNFSFGGYFKKEAIQYAYEFITSPDWMNLKIDYVTVFESEEGVPADEESEQIWRSLDPNISVKRFGRADNFWGPTGDEGPCGPTTEIYVDGIEIWNIVFNQYYQHKDKTLKPLETPGIDTGMGLERLALVSQFPGQTGEKTVFETDLFEPITETLPKSLEIKAQRIITDHIRSTIFLLADGVRPSNKEQGYILRRLIRRIVVHESIKKTKFNLINLVKDFQKIYLEIYPELINADILEEFLKEVENFKKTLEHGMKEFEQYRTLVHNGSEEKYISGEQAFFLYTTYGFPIEITKEIARERGLGVEIDVFNSEMEKHREISKVGAEKKFGGHGLLLDTGELKAANEEELAKVTRLHTATHLLQAALRKVLGDSVTQAGSDITAERLRFDFTFPRKMTPEEIKQTEDLVNEVVRKDLPVIKKTLPYEEAIQTGALHFFKIKYPPMVDVYTVGEQDNWFSKEFCGGPHVEHTGTIGTFKIVKEEATSAGVRRIRATLMQDSQ